MPLNNATKMANRFGHKIKFYQYDANAVSTGYKAVDGDGNVVAPYVIDFALNCSLDTTSELTWANGGQGNDRLVPFGNPIEGTYTITTQISAMPIINMIAGGSPYDDDIKTVVWRNEDSENPFYVVEADTVYKTTGGEVVYEVITLHKAAVNKSYAVEASGEGDPPSLEIVLDLAANEDKDVFTIQRDDSPIDND